MVFHPDDFNDLLRIQRMMASTIIQESSVDSKIKLLDLINKLVTDRNRKVQTETVLIEAENEGFSEAEVLHLIDELIEDNLIIQPEVGYLKRA
jgi:DNA replicative helicase MCM subunit Mcm2 (Cdc46/Mcm family)